MTRISKLNLDLEEALLNLYEFREKGDKIHSTVSEYLISNGFVKLISVEVNSISELMEGRRKSFETNSHYIWTPLGKEVYAKLNRYDSLLEIVKPLYKIFI